MGATKKARINRAATARLDELAEFRYRLRKFLSFSEVASEAVGISAQQYQLLQVVAAGPEGRESSISYVAERMLVRHNSAVELVDRAVKSGLVCRVADESDHRRSLLEITERGAEVLARLVAEHLAEIDAEGPEMMRALQRLIAGRAGSSRRTGER
jgi:DNA-binding MarR family transcriptional regulator